MSRSFEAIEAIYEGGVLKPLKPTHFREGDRVRLLVEQSRDLSKTQRLPDPPLEERSNAAPFDLPRNPGKRVLPRRAAKRLPDGVGF